MSASSSSDEDTALDQADTDAISESVERMFVSRPDLATLSLSVVVQFYDAAGMFWCETSELSVPQEFVVRCAADDLEGPVRLPQTFTYYSDKSCATQIPIAEQRVQSQESFGESPGDLPVYDADECASAFVPTSPPPMIDNQALWDLFDNTGSSSSSGEEYEDTSDPELPPTPHRPSRDVIPRSGTCIVLAVLGTGCPVLVGLVSERYDLDRPYSVEELAEGGVAHVKIQSHKRVYWRGSEEEKADVASHEPRPDDVHVKRRRANGEDGAAAESVALPKPLPAASDTDADAASLDTATWASQMHTGQSRCWWWLDETTGRLDNLKIELALHSAFLRDTLNMALGHFTL